MDKLFAAAQLERIRSRSNVACMPKKFLHSCRLKLRTTQPLVESAGLSMSGSVGTDSILRGQSMPRPYSACPSNRSAVRRVERRRTGRD